MNVSTTDMVGVAVEPNGIPDELEPGKFPHYPEGVPDELKLGDVWVCCDKNKAPMVALVRWRQSAKSTDPATWRSYEAAVAAFETGRYAGIGRVIEADGPYVGVDIDHCRNRETGHIDARGSRILALLDSYSEVSPLGEGVKVWVRAQLGRAYVKQGLEIYPRGRYFTITGQLLPQYSTSIEERTDALNTIIAEEFPRGGAPETPRAPYDGPPIDILDYLRDVEILAELPDNGGIKFAIVCPWVEEHSNNDASGTYVGQFSDGAPWFCCWHAHCAGRGWSRFRQVVRRRAKKLQHEYAFYQEDGWLKK